MQPEINPTCGSDRLTPRPMFKRGKEMEKKDEKEKQNRLGNI